MIANPWRRDPRMVLLAVTSSATAIALSLTGEVSPVGLLVPFVAAFACVRPRTTPRGRLFEWTFQFIAIGFFGWFVLALFHGDWLGGAALLTFPAQAYLFLQPPSLHSTGRLQTLGFFQLVALAASTTAIFFGPLVLLHVLLAPMLYSLSSLEAATGAPRRPAALPSGLARSSLLASAALTGLGLLAFLALPRYEAGLGRAARANKGRMSGFSDTVTLGDITSIQTSDAIVMRVKVTGDAPPELRWRGIALDRFSGREWENTAPNSRPEIRGEEYEIATADPRSPKLVQEFSVEPSLVRALFHAEGATSISPETFRGVRRDEWGNLQRLGEPRRRARYRVVSDLRPLAGSLTEDQRKAFLQLPDLDPRVRDAALAVAGEGDDALRARRVLDWLRQNCSYALDVNDKGVADPVAWFLFDGRRGHCEYFATSMAVMLRVAGIPSRVVNGFQGGDYSRLFGSWIVRQRHAHSWVEAWIPDRGWTTFDPTPPTLVDAPTLGDAAELLRQAEILWDDNVIGFSVNSQLGFLTTLRETGDRAVAWLLRVRTRVLAVIACVVVAAAGAGVIVLLRSRRRRAARRRVAFHDEAIRLLARRGHPRRDAQTALEHARDVATRDPALGAAALELAHLYYSARWGGLEPDAERVKALLDKLAA